MRAREGDQLFAGSNSGACNGHPDPDMWFRSNQTRADYRKVKDICASCPVVKECLEYALQYYDILGIWGGETQGARRIIAKERGIRQKSMLYGHSSGRADTNFLA